MNGAVAKGYESNSSTLFTWIVVKRLVTVPRMARCKAEQLFWIFLIFRRQGFIKCLPSLDFFLLLGFLPCVKRTYHNTRWATPVVSVFHPFTVLFLSYLVASEQALSIQWVGLEEERDCWPFPPSHTALQDINNLETQRSYETMVILENLKFWKKSIERFPNYFLIC